MCCKHRLEIILSRCRLVEKLAFGNFFDDVCTICLGAFGSPGGKWR